MSGSPVGHGAVPSPCVSICTMNPDTGYCLGCYRTIDEIALWSTLPERDKRHVWALLPERRARGLAADPDNGD